MIVADILGGAGELGGAAETGEFVVGLGAHAAGRIFQIVERRIGDAGADRRNPLPARCAACWIGSDAGPPAGSSDRL